LVAAMKNIDTAVTDPAKLQTALGDIYKAVVGAQNAGCLPSLPGTSSAPLASPAPPAPPDSCLEATVNLLSAVLGGVSATLATPPDGAATLAAITKLGTAVKAVNDGKCLPVPLSVPGAATPPVSLPAPPPVPVPPAP
jgi:hypothetical protein